MEFNNEFSKCDVAEEVNNKKNHRILVWNDITLTLATMPSHWTIALTIQPCYNEQQISCMRYANKQQPMNCNRSSKPFQFHLHTAHTKKKRLESNESSSPTNVVILSAKHCTQKLFFKYLIFIWAIKPEM